MASDIEKSDWLPKIEKDAQKRAERLVKAGIRTDDLETVYEELRESLLELHYENHPEDRDQNVVFDEEPEPDTTTQDAPTIQGPRRSDTIKSETSIPPATPVPDPPVIPPSSSTPIQVTDRRGIIVVQTHTPQRLQTPETDKAYERTREYRSMVKEAGMFTLSAEEQAELSAKHPNIDFSGTNLSTAANFSLLGIDTNELGRKVKSSNVLTRAEQNQLLNINAILTVLYAADAELANDLREVNLYPQIVIERRDPIIAPLPDNSGAIAMSSVGDTVQPLLNFASGEAKKRASSAITNKITGKAAKDVAVKTATKVATKAVVSSTAAEAGAAAGSVVPVLGTAIGAAAGWLLGSVAAGAIDFLSKRADDLKNLAGGLIIGGGQAIGAIGALLWAATVNIGYGIIIAIISIPIVVAFILFILNTGAWVVPPWQGIGGIPGETDSAFIDVTKTPNPSYVANAPTTITYTITITAEQSTLTNVTYDYSCYAILEGGTINCPSEPNVVEIAMETCGSSISSLGSCTFSYEVTYDGTYQDSLVSDTITVAADTEGLIGEVSTATANVIIGNPPTGCMFAAGNNWPADLEAILNSTIITIQTQHTAYATLVCNGSSAPTIPICYGPTAGTWGYHFHETDCDITLDSENTGWALSSASTLYILVHELGHHLHAINGGLFQQYLDVGAPSELPLCSYIGTNLPGVYGQNEGFSEAFALYIAPYWPTRCQGGSFESFYPIHYNFVFDVLN